MSSNRSHIDLSRIGFEIRIPHREIPTDNNRAKEDTRRLKDDEAMLAALKQQQRHLEEWVGEGKLTDYSSSRLPTAVKEGVEWTHDLIEEPVEDYPRMSCRSSSYLTFDSDCYLPEEGEDVDDNDGATTTSSKLIQVDLGYEDVIVPSRSHGDLDDSSSLHTRLSTGRPIQNKRSAALRRASQCSGISTRRGSQCSGLSRRTSQCSGRSSGLHRRAQRTTSRGSICSNTSSLWREEDDRGSRPRRLSIASHSSLRQRPDAARTNSTKVSPGGIGQGAIRDSSISGGSMEDDIAQACKELQDLAIDDDDEDDDEVDDLSSSPTSSHLHRRPRCISLELQKVSRGRHHDSPSRSSSAFSPVPESVPTRQASPGLSIRASNMLRRTLTDQAPSSRVTRQSTTSRRVSDCGVHNSRMLSGSTRTNGVSMVEAGVSSHRGDTRKVHPKDNNREMDAAKDQLPSPTCPRQQLQASVDGDASSKHAAALTVPVTT